MLTGIRITHTFSPRGCCCHLNNILAVNQLHYYFFPHSPHEITNSVKLPEMTIDDRSSAGGKAFRIEAIIELEDGGRRCYTKQIKESDLSIVGKGLYFLLFRLKVETAVQSQASRILSAQEFRKNRRLKRRHACELQDKIRFSTKMRMKIICNESPRKLRGI